MPVRGLAEFLRDRGLLRTDSIEALRGTSIGIDGYVWLRKLQIREPLREATGDGSQALPVALSEQLRERPFTQPDDRLAARQRAWQEHAANNLRAAVALFSQSASAAVVSPDLVADVIRFLRGRNADAIRAPYLSWAQLGYMEGDDVRMVDGVHAQLEVLLFGARRVIVSLDLAEGTFEWVDRDTVLAAAGASADQFLDACLLSGFDFLGTFPPSRDTPLHRPPAAIDLVLRYRTGYGAVRAMMGGNGPSSPGPASLLSALVLGMDRELPPPVDSEAYRRASAGESSI
eukprot:tig00000215_g18631.t1